MNIFDLQNDLFQRFKQMNEISKKKFITDSNVAELNTHFETPLNDTYFEIFFLSNMPENVSLGNESLDRYKDIMQIDICIPIKKQGSEKTIFNYLCQLFEKGTEIGEFILIDKIYLSGQLAEKTHKRYQVRIMWTADI